MSKLDRPSLPVEDPPGYTFRENKTYFALTPEQKEEAIAEYDGSNDLQEYLANYAVSNNMHAPQELIDRALSEYTATYGHSLPEDNSLYMRDYIEANNMTYIRRHTDREHIIMPYPYIYRYTNLTTEELQFVTSLATAINNNIPVSPEGIHALVMAFAQHTSRDITSVRLTDEEVEREEAQERRRARRARSRSTTNANRARSLARRNRRQNRNTRSANSQLVSSLTRNWRRGRINNHGTI
jgi:hypothetical protein